MLPIDQLLSFIMQINIWDVAKIMVLFALTVYIVLAFLIMREVDLMSKTVKTNFNFILKIIGLGHFVFSLVVFYLALVIL